MYTSRFATKLGGDNGKQVEKTAIEDLNDLVDGYTYCFQRSMKTVFSLLPAEEAADRAFIFARIDELLTSNTEAFQDSLSGLPPNQRALLSAAAVEGRANTFTSTEFIHRLGLGAVSSVQSAARSLLKRQLMTRDPQNNTIWMTNTWNYS
jgi:DNA-directed RNA polymerase specialized sigma24 family protein